VPSETRGIFTFNYEGHEMKCATIKGRELSSYLLGIINSGDKVTMDNVTDQIFSEIKQFDNDNLYGLSIALTNYYFETFWFASMMNIQDGKTKKAEENMIWSCENVWKQEVIKNYTFHKGTPYYFLGFSYLINGNLDLAFQMIHNGHIDGLKVYHILGLDYKTAPSYLFMTLNINNPRNALYGYVEMMKKKLETFIRDHNTLSTSSTSYLVFDKKFLQRDSTEFDEIKFVLVYLLMNLINLDKHNKKSLTENSFSNLRKIELMRSLSLIVDKTLAEKYGTNTIADGVIQYFVKHIRIPENDSAQLQNVLSYADGDPFLINVNVEHVVNELLAHGVRYKNNPLSYPMTCMLLVWNLRNFSAHNLSGINQLLTNSYHSILSMLFSALFFAAEIL
jgi:hypothetical protein